MSLFYSFVKKVVKACTILLDKSEKSVYNYYTGYGDVKYLLTVINSL